MTELLEFIKENTAIVVYLAIISLIAVITTIKDKISAKISTHRTPEMKLLLISALGGSVAMLLTMLLIRHKTKHLKFMIGIPLIIALQAVALYYLHSRGFLV